MSPPRAAQVAAVLRRLGAPGAPLLGAGNEAAVHALDARTVVRVLGSGGAVDEHLLARAALADELRDGLPFALPELLEHGTTDGVAWTTERRLPGRSLLEELRDARGADRAHLVTGLLDAVLALGRAPLRPRSWWGDLLGGVREASWPGWLVVRADRGRAGIPELDPQALAADVLAALPWSDADRPGFLHLDAFPGNVLTDGRRITAVIDLGATSAVGDPRLDVVAAVAYLDEPITPTALDADRAVARRWLDDHGLLPALAPVRRWLAGYWGWATDDAALHAWCRAALER